LTVGATGSVTGRITAATVIVHGTVDGPVTATEKIDVRDGGRIDGDLASPRIAIAEGAQFRGAVDMGVAARQAVVGTPAGKATFEELPMTDAARTRQGSERYTR
jgi:cytoskeletal protein CcmA (bactofilin family)